MAINENKGIQGVNHIRALVMTAMLVGAVPLASAGDQGMLGNTLRFHVPASTAPVQAATEQRPQAGTTLRFAGSLSGEMRSREAFMRLGTTLRFVAPHEVERATVPVGTARLSEQTGSVVPSH